jgi:hypothetical protein
LYSQDFKCIKSLKRGDGTLALKQEEIKFVRVDLGIYSQPKRSWTQMWHP